MELEYFEINIAEQKPSLISRGERNLSMMCLRKGNALKEKEAYF